jgi:hypothetical protein
MNRQRYRDDSESLPAHPAPEEVTEQISDLLAGYALDALSDDETAYIDRYLPDRKQWQLELAGYSRVSSLLPYSSEPHQVPVRARAAILARIDALAIESQEEAIARASQPATIGSQLRRWRAHVPRVAWAAAVPATIIAVVFIMTSILMQDRITEQQAELAAFQQEQVRVNEVLLADNSGQQVVELVQSNVAPLARGRLFIDRHDNTAMLMVRDMPPPGNGQTYVVWLLIGTNGNEYAQFGELSVDQFGRGQIILDPPDDFNQYSVVSITVEQTSGIDAPIGPEVMTGGIAPRRSN